MLERIEKADQIETAGGAGTQRRDAKILAVHVQPEHLHAALAGEFQERAVAIPDVKNFAAWCQMQAALNEVPSQRGHLPMREPVVAPRVCNVIDGGHTQIALENMTASE